MARVAGRRRGRLVLPAAAAVVVGLLARAGLDGWPRLLGGPAAALLVAGAYVLVAARTRVDEAARLLATVTARWSAVRALRRAQRRRRR